MVFTITPLYALAAAVIYLVLFVRVSALRGNTGISIGEGGNAHLLHASASMETAPSGSALCLSS